MKTWKNFTVTYKETGEKLKWAFRKNGKYWFLKDHEDYVRTLESSWIDSVPKLLDIAYNYGMECRIS
jgi:hypothetical protein